MIQILLFRHAGFVPGIHGSGKGCTEVSWIAGTSPAMANE
jgi:hypothetical protein